MHNDKSHRAYLLRPEAKPIGWDLLTEYQQIGLTTILESMHAAADQLRAPRRHSSGLDWLAEDRRSQLIFIDGKRGTGKTTLLLSLISLLQNSNADFGFVQAQSVLDTARAIRPRVVILEPLDMEPMPIGTPIMSAILARVNHAATQLGINNSTRQGVLDRSIHDTDEFIRFSQLQARIARSLDGNLNERKAGLDREQFGREVLNQEDDRLMLPVLLAESLALLSRELPGNSTESRNDMQRLFLVPIDDVDLNPNRCLELLRLLRHYSVPQLFFLLMGQKDLVETIAKLSVSAEFDSIAASEKMLSPVSSEKLRREIGSVAIANLHKQIPQVVSLPAIELCNVLNFKPLLGDAYERESLPTLGELFSKIPLSDVSIPISNFRELLELGLTSDVRSAGDFTREQYPGLGAFEVAPRRLVDLWRALSEIFASNATYSETTKRRLLGVFADHWKRSLEEDSELDMSSRELLQREGTSACEVLEQADEDRFDEYRILGAPELPKDIAMDYSPVLRVCVSSLGSGVPRIGIRGRQKGIRGSKIEIRNPRTRCTYVLFHDIQVLLADKKRVQQEPMRVRGLSPIEVRWANDVEGVSWPLPLLPTFARQSQFFISVSFRSSESQITKHQLQSLLYCWTQTGTELLQGKLSQQQSENDWGRLASSLLELTKASHFSPVVLRDWICALIPLAWPDACGLDVQFSAESDSTQSAVVEIMKFITIPDLKHRRENQLKRYWHRHMPVWKYLNRKWPLDDTLNLQVEEPQGDSVSDLQNSVGQLRTQLQRQMLLTRLTSLVQSVTSKQSTDSSVPSEPMRSGKPDDTKMNEILSVVDRLIDLADEEAEFSVTLRDEVNRAVDQLAKIGQYELVAALCKRIIKLLEKATKNDVLPIILAYTKLGRALRDGSLDGAEEAFREASRRATRGELDPIWQSITLRNLADLNFKNGKIEESKDVYLHAKKLLKASKDEDNTSLFVLATVHEGLGNLQRSNADLGSAVAEYCASIEIWKRLLADDESDKVQIEERLTGCLKKLTSIYMEQNNPSGAETIARDVVEILSRLVKNGDDEGVPQHLQTAQRLLDEVTTKKATLEGSKKSSDSGDT